MPFLRSRRNELGNRIQEQSWSKASYSVKEVSLGSAVSSDLMVLLFTQDSEPEEGALTVLARLHFCLRDH